MSTPESTVSPESNTEKEVVSSPVVNVSPTVPETTDSPAKILDGVNSLCNTTLYVLTKGFYPGADAHLVHQAKEFIKEIKKDVESKRKQISNGQKVEGL